MGDVIDFEDIPDDIAKFIDELRDDTISFARHLTEKWNCKFPDNYVDIVTDYYEEVRKMAETFEPSL